MRSRRGNNQGAGYDNLLKSFTTALEANSKEISFALENLTDKELSKEQKSQLKKIQSELKSIDKRLSRLD